jgi:hypothetical protein
MEVGMFRNLIGIDLEVSKVGDAVSWRKASRKYQEQISRISSRNI